MSVFSAVKQLVLEYLGMYTPPVPSLCGRCGQPRSAACGDDFLPESLAVDWGALQQQITTTTIAKTPKPLLRNIAIGHEGFKPTYYTAHPDGLYRVADPQPILISRKPVAE